MAVRLLPDDERRAQSLAIQAAHAEWIARQLAAGVDGPTPADRPEPSDYNQHVPDLEAPPEAEDAYWAAVRKALL
jgi:hypothetical protein